MHKILFAIFMIATNSLSTLALGQSDAKTAAPTACPEAAQVSQADLLGLWRAHFAGQAPSATLLLEKNAEFPDAVSGAISRGAARAQVAGDVEEGEFSLEESTDGTTISAVWTGQIVPGSCGKEIQGTWQPTGGEARAFVLRKGAP